MTSISLVELIRGLVPIVLIAYGSGHIYGLGSWAAREAFKPWHSTQFFPEVRARDVSSHARNRAHPKTGVP